MKEKIKRFLQMILHAVSRNLGWKIFSLIIAILMWSYIISSDPTITRDKTLTNVEITTSGLSVLQSRDLALLTDPTRELQDVRVHVQVPQAYYSRVSPDTVRVELDLSQIRQTGRQEVELHGVSNYGEVVLISPSRVEVVIEKLDQRNVPVNVELTGNVDELNYWYGVSRINPESISVSGPSSVVRKIASARVQLDVSGTTRSYTWTAAPELLDKQGNVITQTLSKSSSSVSALVSIYPIKQLPVVADISTATVGTLLDGYSISHIEVQPERITVAADEELLEQLDFLTFTPVNVTGRSRSFSATMPVTKLTDIAHLSSEQVTVTVYIEELDNTQLFRSVPLDVTGKTGGQQIKLGQSSIEVKVTGPHSVFDSLMRSDILARVDVTGLAPGTYSLPITVSTDNYPDLILEPEPKTVNVTIYE